MVGESGALKTGGRKFVATHLLRSKIAYEYRSTFLHCEYGVFAE